MKNPDWKNENDYDYTESFEHDKTAWAWEFLRRNSKYREEYYAFHKGQINKKTYLPPKKADETEQHWLKRCATTGENPIILSAEETLSRKWRLRGKIPNPDLTAAESSKSGIDIQFECSKFPIVISSWDDLEKVPTVELDQQCVVIDSNYLLVLLDRSMPKDKQIDAIREQLDSDNNTAFKSPKLTNRKLQLRILDAAAQGASNSDIGKILFPEYHGNVLVKVNNSLKTANHNVSTGYIDIANRSAPL